MSINNDGLLGCPARVTLDSAQTAFLDELCATAPGLQSELGCELECGHPGSHAALGQHVDDAMWWVHWTLIASDIKQYTWCSARRAAEQRGADDDSCVLFDGHPGRHSSAKEYWEAA